VVHAPQTEAFDTSRLSDAAFMNYLALAHDNVARFHIDMPFLDIRYSGSLVRIEGSFAVLASTQVRLRQDCERVTTLQWNIKDRVLFVNPACGLASSSH
jgi:hypothetical protein